MTAVLDLRAFIRNVPDFPKPGVMFKDITPLLSDPKAFAQVLAEMADPFRVDRVTKVAAIESRGFIFGGALARELNAGFVPIRKKGKLPYKAASVSYELEYGAGELEMHVDAAGPDDHVLIVDDVLATGGTASATARLVESVGARVTGLCFLAELGFLKGRDKLPARRISSLITF